MSFDDCANFFKGKVGRFSGPFLFISRSYSRHEIECCIMEASQPGSTQTENLSIASIRPMSGRSIATFLFLPLLFIDIF